LYGHRGRKNFLYELKAGTAASHESMERTILALIAHIHIESAICREVTRCASMSDGVSIGVVISFAAGILTTLIGVAAKYFLDYRLARRRLELDEKGPS
jgi:hypothetical protein